MITTVGWCLVCIAVSLILKNKPITAAGSAIALYTLVPLSATDILLFYKPGEYFLIIYTLIYFSSNKVKELLEGSRFIVVSAVVISLFFIISRVMGVGSLSATLLIISRTIVLPLALFLIIIHGLKYKDNKIGSLVFIVSILTVFEIILSIYQNSTGQILFWENEIRSQWFIDDDFVVSQPLGTFGHWIPLSVFLALALTINMHVRSKIIFFIISIGSIYVLALSAARSGIIAFGIIFVAILAQFIISGSVKTKLVTLCSLPILVLTFTLIFFSEAGEVFRGKLVDDNNSTSLRLRAIDWFWYSIDEFLVSGRIQGSNLREEGVLTTSLENAFYIFALQFGFVSMVLLMIFFSLVFISSIYRSRGNRIIVFVSTISFIFTCFTNGAFSVGEYATLIIFWSVLAICIGASKPKNLNKMITN